MNLEEIEKQAREAVKSAQEALELVAKARESKPKLWKPKPSNNRYLAAVGQECGFELLPNSGSRFDENAVRGFGAFPSALAAAQANQLLIQVRAQIMACQQSDPDAGAWESDRRWSPYYDAQEEKWKTCYWMYTSSQPCYVHTEEQCQHARDLLNNEGVRP